MNLHRKIHIELAGAEQKAWAALAGYKFWMFGYWAARWVGLNRLLDERRPNPFAPLVKLARAKKGAP